MRAIRRIVAAILGTCFWLVVFIILTAFIAKFYVPPYKSLNANQETPKYFPFIGFWNLDTGETICRAFWVFQLKNLRASVPELQLKLTPESLKACQASSEFLKNNERWPVTFSWDEKNRWPFAHIDLLQNSVVSVSYAPDDDLVNRSKYRIVNGEIHNAQYQSYFGPGIAIRSMPYSLGLTLLLWFVIALGKRLLTRGKKK